MISKTLSLILVSLLFSPEPPFSYLQEPWNHCPLNGPLSSHMKWVGNQNHCFPECPFFGGGGGLTIDISSKKYSSHPARNHYLLFLSHKSTVSKQFSYFIFHMESGSQKLVLEGPQRSVILFIYSIYICWEPFYFRNCFRYWGNNDQDRQESSVQGNKDNWKSS